MRIENTRSITLKFAAAALIWLGPASLMPTATAERLTDQVSFQEEGDAEYLDALSSDGSGYGGGYGAGSCFDCLSGSQPIYWASADYLLVWNKGGNLPALVTTSPAGTAQGSAGVLPGATTLFGGSRLDDGARNGGRIELGRWLNDEATSGIAFRVFALETESLGYAGSSDAAGSPIIARPFLDAQTNLQASHLVAFPTRTSGSIDAQTSLDVNGADFYLRQLLFEGSGNRIDLIGGYQYSRINDELRVSESLTSIDAGYLGGIGGTLSAFDLLDVKNEFHGGTIGLMVEMEDGPITWKLMGKAGLGNMQQTLTIDGSNTVTVPGGSPTTTAEGLLALPSNIGTYENSSFTVIPEAQFSLVYHLNCRVDLGVGYSFMYWSNVMRAGDQVDTTLDLSQGTNNPTANLVETDYWIQGLHFTFGYNW